jgi:hypothetical protein
MAEKNKNHVSALFQIIAFFVASVCLIAVFYKPFMMFKSYDNVPSVAPYTLLYKNGIPVYTGLIIHNFVESDIIKDNISIDATISFAYDPQKITREQIAQFDFDEATIEKNQINYHQYGELEVATFDIQVRSKMDFNFKAYPLDDHSFWFSLKNSALPIEKYYFNVLPHAFVLGPRMTINNCMAENVHAQVGFVPRDVMLPDGKHEMHSSRAIFSVDCNPIDMRHFLSIFLPLYLIFFLTLFSFSFGYSEHVTDVPGIAAAGVPALFAYRFVIEAISPNVSYFMVSDYLFFLYLFLSLLTFISVSWALNYSARAKQAIIISLYTVMLIGCTVIAYTA